MGKTNFEEVSEKLWNTMKSNGETGIMKYKPFSDQYWINNPKIVICNYEAFGYRDSKENALSFEYFKVGLMDSKRKTIRNTAVFIYTLQQMLSKSDFTWHNLAKEKLYDKIDILHETMRNVMYMNIRPDSGSGRLQETKETRIVVQKYKNEIKDFIMALDADIFILSSKHSPELFNDIFNIKENPLKYKGCMQLNNTAVFSVPHFSRPDYSYYLKKAKEIATAFLAKETKT